MEVSETRMQLGGSVEMLDGSESFGSPPGETIFRDVALVPEDKKKELEQTISNLEGEVEELKSQLRCLDGKRRAALNKLLDLKGSIRVFCRIRPFLQVERRNNAALVSAGTEKVLIQGAQKKKEYVFDRVLGHESSQEDVFVEVEPILRSALDGHNVCIFAYGQTGTGKTFTMEGTPDCPGIVPRAIKALLHRSSLDATASFKFSLSMVEVYMGSLRDLLAHKLPTRTTVSSCVSRSGLNMQTDSNGAVEIEGLTEVLINDFAQANRNYLIGKKARSTCWTNVNEASSRSHCLTRVTVARDEGGKIVSSKLWMVDLGGSERLLKTKATGQTLDEGRAINLSLSALGDVICALRRKRNHVPYRNSKLTQILKDSLGDDSKALMIIHASPKDVDLNETVCSINFGQRARGMKCHKELSEELKNLRKKKIAEIDQEMRDIDRECQRVRDHTQRVESKLQERKKIRSMTYGLENETGSPRCPLSVPMELFESPIVSVRAMATSSSASVPRFMAPTVCSKQRQLAESETKVTKISRSSRKYLTDADFQLSGSRILFQSQSSLKASLNGGLSRRSNAKKLRTEELNSVRAENPSDAHFSPKASRPEENKRLSASPLVSHKRNFSDPMFHKRVPRKMSGNSCKTTKFARASMPSSLELIPSSAHQPSVDCH